MIPRPIHGLMARLALLAMVLLLAVPTAGRLAAHRDTALASPLTALCTLAGLKFVGLESEQAPLALPEPAKPRHPGMDCDYCPLLASVVVLAVLFVLFPQAFALSSAKARPDVPHSGGYHPCGLGSRGPPALLLQA